MNIGEEAEEAVEVPIPLMPGQTQQPDPVMVPAPEEAPELVPAGTPASEPGEDRVST